MKPVIKQNKDTLRFKCPGYKMYHVVRYGTDTEPNWTWNGSLDKPTISPSILATYNGKDAGINGAPPSVCHSFVREGKFQFLSDCTHNLAGQTVDIPEWTDTVYTA